MRPESAMADRLVEGSDGTIIVPAVKGLHDRQIELRLGGSRRTRG